jgi:hypothetical protein
MGDLTFDVGPCPAVRPYGRAYALSTPISSHLTFFQLWNPFFNLVQFTIGVRLPLPIRLYFTHAQPIDLLQLESQADASRGRKGQGCEEACRRRRVIPMPPSFLCIYTRCYLMFRIRHDEPRAVVRRRALHVPEQWRLSGFAHHALERPPAEAVRARAVNPRPRAQLGGSARRERAPERAPARKARQDEVPVQMSSARAEGIAEGEPRTPHTDARIRPAA